MAVDEVDRVHHPKPALILCFALVAALLGCGGDPPPPPAPEPATSTDPLAPPPVLPREPFPESVDDFPKVAEKTLTFSADIAPIFFEHCIGCHREGDAAPFPLVTYDEVRRRATEIATVTKLRFMPPWLPEAGHGNLAGARGLTVDQVGKIQQWIFEGMDEGDPAELPPMPEFPSGWAMGEPDVVVRLPRAYTLRADGPDVFRNFVLADVLPEDRWVQGYQFRPKNPQVVHHATIQIDRTEKSLRLDAEDDEPGFHGMQSEAATMPDGYFLGWVPGRQAHMNPEGRSWRLRQGTDLVLQLHMLPSGKPESVDPDLGLYFTDEPPTEVPWMIRIGSRTMDIPAGEPAYVVNASYRVPVDVDVLGVAPHAHYLAQDMKAWATLPDGSKAWLIWIRDWDFNWQDEYRYAEPVFLPRGSTIFMQYTYDNSTGNIQNPHSPPRRVLYGPSTYDEMGDLWVQTLPKRAEDLEVLRADYLRYDRERKVARYRVLVGREPENAVYRNQLGHNLMNAGQLVEAVDQFREAVRLDPGYVVGTRNLAAALFNAGELPESLDQFDRAVTLDPDHAETQAQYGNALGAAGRFDEAIERLQAAIELKSDFPQARYNLGRAYELTGRLPEALAEYRRAADEEPSWLPPLNASAWLAATRREVLDPERAVRDAMRAADLTGYRDPIVLETLAAAYGAAGRFSDATRTAEQAVLLLRQSGAQGQARRLQRLSTALELYRVGQPFREG